MNKRILVSLMGLMSVTAFANEGVYSNVSPEENLSQPERIRYECHVRSKGKNSDRCRVSGDICVRREAPATSSADRRCETSINVSCENDFRLHDDRADFFLDQEEEKALIVGNRGDKEAFLRIKDKDGMDSRSFQARLVTIDDSTANDYKGRCEIDFRRR